MSRTLNELLQMQRNQLTRINKDELVDILVAAQQQDGNSTQAILARLTELVAEVVTLKQAVMSPDSAINKKVQELQQQVNKQADIIAKQQRYLESLDRKERECNLVVMGIPEDQEALDGATTDREKVTKVWEAAQATCLVKSVRRLGRPAGAGQSERRRPILVTVESREDRDAMLGLAKHLKTAGERYKKIFIKKDVHPTVREEWKRLRESEKRERERPENVGCNISLNVRERKLYKDGIVIDEWSCSNF